MQTYRIVDGKDNVVDDLVGLNLANAERVLCNVLNHGEDAYLQEEDPSEVELVIRASRAERPGLTDVIRSYRQKGWTEDDIGEAVRIGFCQPKFYKRSSWARSKILMDTLIVPLGLAYPHDFGRGKGKYESEFDINTVVAEIVNLICCYPH